MKWEGYGSKWSLPNIRSQREIFLNETLIIKRDAGQSVSR
jgi:hypothetical protein